MYCLKRAQMLMNLASEVPVRRESIIPTWQEKKHKARQNTQRWQGFYRALRNIGQHLHSAFYNYIIVKKFKQKPTLTENAFS